MIWAPRPLSDLLKCLQWWLPIYLRQFEGYSCAKTATNDAVAANIGDESPSYAPPYNIVGNESPSYLPPPLSDNDDDLPKLEENNYLIRDQEIKKDKSEMVEDDIGSRKYKDLDLIIQTN